MVEIVAVKKVCFSKIRSTNPFATTEEIISGEDWEFNQEYRYISEIKEWDCIKDVDIKKIREQLDKKEAFASESMNQVIYMRAALDLIDEDKQK